MEKFNSSKHSEYSKNLPFSYFSSDIYLDYIAYTFERNGEHLIVWQDMLYPNEFPSIYTPTKKENWASAHIAMAADEDIENIKKEGIEIILQKPMGKEFFYATEEIANPKKDLLNKVNRFKNNYPHKVLNSYDRDKIVEFFNFWKNQREHNSITFDESEDFFYFCLDYLDKYGVKQVYVESEGKLIGFTWGVQHQKGWLGLHLKVDYSFKGLSRFLHSERAKLFPGLAEFTTGTGAHDKNIDQYKEELGPTRTVNYSYLLTGQKSK